MHTTTSALFIYWNVSCFGLDDKQHAVIIMSPEILEPVFWLLPVYLPFLDYIHYSYPLAFTDSLVSTMRSHAVLCFFQWETWHSLKNEKENYFKYKTWYWRQKSETCTLWWKHLKSIVLIVEKLKVLHVLTEHILHQSLHKLIVIIIIYHLLLHHLSKNCYHSLIWHGVI